MKTLFTRTELFSNLLLAAGLFAALYAAVPAWGGDAGSGKQPAEATNDYPRDPIHDLYNRLKKWPNGKAEAIDHYRAILTEGEKLAAEHPEVPQTAELAEILWRRIMLPAAERLHLADGTPENRRRLLDIATRVANNPKRVGHCIVEEKIHAEDLVLRLTLVGTDGKISPEAGKAIGQMLARYPDDGREDGLTASAHVTAARAAIELKQTALADSLLDAIDSRYRRMKGAVDVLCLGGRAPLFEATLVDIDGKEIRFPHDARGKVVVIDYWAMWCGPCRAALPHIKQLWEKYRDKGVLFIGDSWDRASKDEPIEKIREKIKSIAEQDGFGWTHTAGGLSPSVSAWNHGITNIPHVMIVGRDGRVFAYQARGNEESLIDEAIKASAPKS